MFWAVANRAAQDAGRVHSWSYGATEDEAMRRFEAAAPPPPNPREESDVQARGAWNQPSSCARGRDSVEPGILGHPGHEPVLAALALQHVAPQRLRVDAEHVAGEGRLDEPGVLLELALELALAPARVARVPPHPGDLLGEAVHVRIDPDRGDRPAHRAVRRGAGVLGERDHGLRLHRPAREHVAV